MRPSALGDHVALAALATRNELLGGNRINDNPIETSSDLEPTNIMTRCIYMARRRW